MGKLAERLSDSARSGVYRIETREALEEAAALNAYPVVNVVLDHVTTKSGLFDAVGRLAAVPDRFGGDWDALRRLADWSWAPAPGHVLLVSGFELLVRAAPEEFEQFLRALTAAAADWRNRGKRFFVAFLDPRGAAPLAPLYNWHKASKQAAS